MNHMTHKQQDRGQFVGVSGLRKIAGPPGSAFEVIVIDRRGRPVSHLSEWYRRRHEPGPDRTRQTYLGMLFPVMGFFLERGYAWNDPPEQIPVIYMIAILSYMKYKHYTN